MPLLQLFVHEINMYAGTLPASWGSADAFRAMSNLALYNMPISGALPPLWGSNASWPALTFLKLGSGRLDMSCISGPLPSEWGSSVAFQLLQTLDIGACLSGITQTTVILHDLHVFN